VVVGMALKLWRPTRAQDAAKPERRLYERQAELYVEGKDAHALAAHVLQPDPLGRFARVFESLRPERGETAIVTVDLLPLSRGERHRHVGRLVAAARDATAVDGQDRAGQPAARFARELWAGMNGDSGPLLGRRPPTSRANPADLAVRRAELRPTVVRITETDALFALQVLLKTTATSKGRTVELLVALRDCFAAFTGSSWFKTRGIGPTLRLGNREVTPFFLGSDMPWHRGWFDHRLASGLFDPPRRGNVVAGKEVAAFLRPPTKHCASTEVVRSGGLIPAPPADLPTYRYQPDLLPLGEIDTADGTRLVAVPAEDTKFVYTSGRADFGKTTGALCRFLHWALRTPHGGLFLDPHVDGLVEMLPYLTSVADRLVIINLADTDKQGGWNLCSMTGRTRNDIEARVDAIVDSVATVTGWGERNGRALNLISQAAKSVIELAMVLPRDLQPTIFQITTLLADPEWRDTVVPCLSAPLRAFWRTRFGLLDTNAITPVTNLIDRLRNSRSISALLGASQSSFDMRRAMDTGQLVLVCPAGSGPKERLIANFVIRDLYRAALTRIDTARERRRPFYAVLDEALALDTPLPTPTGWTTMREVRVGDRLIGADGSPTTVIAATGVMRDRRCYRMTFADGTSVVASAGHQWLTRMSGSPTGARVRTTEEMAAAADVQQRGRCQVPRQQPLRTPDIPLPIDPYVLGLWLGDGDSRSAIIATGAADLDQLEREIRRRGYTTARCAPTATSSGLRLAVSLPGAGTGHHSGHVGERNGRAQLTAAHVAKFRATAPGERFYGAKRLATRYGVSPQVIERVRQGVTWNPDRNATPVKGLHIRLREQGLLGDKHVPARYLRAGTRQREELLRGLMDSDGHAGNGGFCTFVTTSEALRDGIAELLRSLGQVPHVTWRADPRSRAGGAFKVTFTPRGIVPFSLPRKARRVQRRKRPARGSDWTAIIRIEPVAALPVRCVAVDAPDRLFLAGEGWHVTHNCQIYDDETLPEMLEQLRKFQVKGDLLNQDPRRLRTDTWAGLTTNRSILQSSTLGEGGAKIIAGELGGEVSPETIMSLERHTFVSQVRLGNQTTKPFLIRTVPPDRMWAEHRNDAALADLDTEVDRTMGRRPVDDTIAELNTLDGRILDWLKQHRPRPSAPSPNGDQPSGAPPAASPPGMVGRSRTRKRREAPER
jgi:hypothetical protein